MMLTRIIAFSTLSALISAQTLDSLPQCGQLCVNNMLGKARDLGCADNDKVCLCRNIDFAYGIRDCSHEVCGPEQAAPVVAYGMSYCSSVSNDVPPPGGNTPPKSSPAAPMPMPGNHTMTDMPSSSSMAISSPTGTNSAISTSTIISLITSGSEVQTSTVGFKTIYSSSMATPPSSTNSNDSPSSSSSPTSTPTSSDTSGDTQSSTSSAGGCKQTVFAGLAVAAGLAAMII